MIRTKEQMTQTIRKLMQAGGWTKYEILRWLGSEEQEKLVGEVLIDLVARREIILNQVNNKYEIA